MFSDSQRLELEPFGIKVVDLKTGSVKTNFLNHQKEVTQGSLPKGSIYDPAKEAVEKTLRGEPFDTGMPAQEWSRLVVQDLLRKRPPPNIWRG